VTRTPTQGTFLWNRRADSSGIVTFDKAEVILERTEMVNVTVPVPTNATANATATATAGSDVKADPKAAKAAEQVDAAEKAAAAAKKAAEKVADQAKTAGSIGGKEEEDAAAGNATANGTEVGICHLSVFMSDRACKCSMVAHAKAKWGSASHRCFF